MGSNSSKNTSQEIAIPNTEHLRNEEILITPMSKKQQFIESEDPRSPTLANRTPMASPMPFHSWRSLVQKDMDPRSPSLVSRTPTIKSTSPARLTEAFDPRSPSLVRTPYGLAASEEVAFGNENHSRNIHISPYVSVNPLSIALSMGMPPAKDEFDEEENEQEAQAEQTEQAAEQTEPVSMQLNQTAEIASPNSEDESSKSRKDGASLFDSNMLTNSNTFHPMQSVEIINPMKASDDMSMRKRKKDGRNESICASPLKRSFTATDAENTQHRGTPIEKSKLSMNILTENMPPAVLS